MIRTLVARAARIGLIVSAVGGLSLAVRPTSGIAPFPAAQAAGIGPIILFSTVKWKVVNQIGLPAEGTSFGVWTPSDDGLLVQDNGARDLDDRVGHFKVKGAGSGEFIVCPGQASAGYYYPGSAGQNCRHAVISVGDTTALPDFSVVIFKVIRWEVRKSNGDLIGGAKFTLKSSTGVDEIGPDPDGTYRLDYRKHGDYQLCMTSAPFGFVGTGCRTFTVASITRIHEVTPDFEVYRLKLGTPSPPTPAPMPTPTPEPTDEPDPGPTDEPADAPAPTAGPNATPKAPGGGTGGGHAGSPAPAATASPASPTASAVVHEPSGDPVATDPGTSVATGTTDADPLAGTTSESPSGPSGPGAAVLLSGVALGLLALVVAVLLRRLASGRRSATA